MMKCVFLLSLLILPAIAMAQPKDVPPECKVLSEHVPSGDVTYQPGVDVYGKPVVPADINAPPMGADKSLVVPLTIDLAQRLQGLNIPGLKMESTLGFLEIAPNGRITYNGQDLTSQVHVLCDKSAEQALPTSRDNMSKPAPKPPGKPAPKPVSANGQKPVNTLKYPPVKEIKPAPAKTAPAPASAPVPPPKKAAEQGELLQGQDYKE